MKKLYILTACAYLNGMELPQTSHQFSPKNLCDSLVSAYKSLTQASQDDLLSRGDFGAMLGKIFTAVESGSPDESAQWYGYLVEKMSLDAGNLSLDQQMNYFNLEVYVFRAVKEIQPAAMRTTFHKTIRQKHKMAALQWLHGLVASDMCGDLEWIKLVSGQATTLPVIAPAQLKAARLKILAGHGIK